MPEYVITLTAIAIVGGLILGAIYFFYNSYRTRGPPPCAQTSRHPTPKRIVLAWN